MGHAHTNAEYNEQDASKRTTGSYGPYSANLATYIDGDTDAQLEDWLLGDLCYCPVTLNPSTWRLKCIPNSQKPNGWLRLDHEMRKRISIHGSCCVKRSVVKAISISTNTSDILDHPHNNGREHRVIVGKRVVALEPTFPDGRGTVRQHVPIRREIGLLDHVCCLSTETCTT